MKDSYLKAQQFGNRYPEWMPNLPSARGQDMNQCAWGSLGPRAHVVPLYHGTAIITHTVRCNTARPELWQGCVAYMTVPQKPLTISYLH